ncbi:unnamed protein product [Lepeophtheirus salmonis]|uniref:(salmon louse) hypothetical protein n=1 Tax=Lepeophtheirus salmonis TaxID=72036 RepID=A0A7R8CTY2_LEPSM|nr:unnamed protein product [Lepeophtheirus salmonis]CAF2929870.1 unnamed protein product [Lepeophtheirus salmonis]
MHQRNTGEKGIFSKCIAFTGDNCNTNLLEIRRPEEGRNVFANLKKQNKSLIGVACPAHTFNNCVRHRADTLDVDIEKIIFKIYKHFHIYTVHTKSLKEYSEFADVEYRTLLYHSKTRWLSLFPGIERFLKMHPALKAFFFVTGKPPMLLKKFFEDEFIKGMLAQKQNDGFGQGCDPFGAEVQELYSACLGYLEGGMAPMEEFSTFMWMDLSEIPDWNYVERCIRHLVEKGVEIDDAKCFDQVTNLKKLIERSNIDEVFSDL